MVRPFLFSILSFYFLIPVVLAQTDWSEANRFINSKNYLSAIQALEMLDSSLMRQEKIAFCQFQLGDYAAAKRTYQQILTADSTNVQAHLYLGSIYDQEFNLPKSIKHFIALTRLDSSNPTYYKMTARVYRKAHLPRLAFKYLSLARQKNNRDINVLLDLSDILMENKQWSLADSLLQKAQALDTNNIKVTLSQAHCAYGRKQYLKVTQFLDRTKGRLDLTPFYQKMLGYAFLQIDSLDRAIHILSNLLHQEESEYTYSYLGKSHLLKNEFEQAIYYYEKAIKAGLSDNLAQYHSALAKLKKENGPWKAVLQHYEEAFRFSQNPTYLFHKGQACEKYYRDKQAAINQYTRFLKLADGDDPYSRFAEERIRVLKEYLHQAGR